MSRITMAIRLVRILPEVIDFITTAIVALSDRRLSEDESRTLVEKGLKILEQIR